MRNKIKFVIFGGIFSLSILPMMASAGVSLAVGKQASVNWLWINTNGCSVTSTYSKAFLSPQPNCSYTPGYDSTDAKSMIQNDLSVPGAYWYTIYGTASDGITLFPVSDWLTITALVPTTAPTLSLSPTTGNIDTSFTLSWTAVTNATTYSVTMYYNDVKTANSPLSLGSSLTFGPATSKTTWAVTAPYPTTIVKYAYQIQGCNASNVCGPLSNLVTFTANPIPAATVNVNLSFLDKIKSSVKETLTYIKNLDLTEKAFAYTSK